MKKLSKKQKIWIGIGLLVVVVLFFYFRKKKKNDTTNSSMTGSFTTSNNKPATYKSVPLPEGFSKPSSCKASDIMKRGDACRAVLNIQHILNNHRSETGTNLLVEDGLFGSKTEEAVQKVLGKKTAAYTDLALHFG